MIFDLLLTFAMLQPIYHESETALWGGQVTRIWNEAGHGVEVTFWPERTVVIVTVGYRGKWIKGFRVW